jgi:hypothetical protein
MSKRSVVEEQWREMLDELDSEELFSNYSNAHILEEVDPVAYRCGLNDWANSFMCVECGDEFCVDDPWNSDGLCEECSAEEED